MDIPWRGERRLEPTSILGALENQYGLDGNGTGNQWTMVCPRSISFGYGHPEGKFGFELALDPPIISCKNLSMKKKHPVNPVHPVKKNSVSPAEFIFWIEMRA